MSGKLLLVFITLWSASSGDVGSDDIYISLDVYGYKEKRFCTLMTLGLNMMRC